MSKRRNHDAAFKARVALKGERPVSELAPAYEVRPTMVHHWKKALLEGAAGIFERGGQAAATAEIAEEAVRDLHAKIGELAVAKNFCRESSNRGPGSEAVDDRADPSQAASRGAVSAAVDLAIVILLCTAGRDRDEP